MHQPDVVMTLQHETKPQARHQIDGQLKRLMAGN
jgi:hypothetical protein